MENSANVNAYAPDFDEANKKKTGPLLSVTKEMLSGLNAGDSRAFDSIYLRCFEPIRGFFRLLLHNDAEAEELCQELFVWIWENRRVIKPDLNFRSYLYTVAKTSAMKHLRHKQVESRYANFRLREDPDLGGALPLLKI